MKHFTIFAARLVLVTAAFLIYAVHCGIEWRHHFSHAPKLLDSYANSHLWITTALISATVLTVKHLARANSWFSIVCGVVHLVELSLAWALFDPTIGSRIASIFDAADETARLAILFTATVTSVIEFVHGVIHVVHNGRSPTSVGTCLTALPQPPPQGGRSI